VNLGLEGRRALVGGATSGLGAAVASLLAREGCRLVLWSRDEQRLEQSAAQLRSAGAAVQVVAADAGEPGSAAVVSSQALEAYGGIDIAVLNAGGPPPVDPLATTGEGWLAAMQLLLLTPVDVATALIPGMRERGWGRVVAILSSGIREPIPALVYSNAGRAALAAWLKTAARAVAGDGVTVNGVVPGRIATARTAALDAAHADREGRTVDEVRAESVAQIPAGRYGEPAEFAAAVVYLCSQQASYHTGSLVSVDGGLLRGL
jgi:3-oxoacyl-[acyl-carrier protein] reductase